MEQLYQTLAPSLSKLQKIQQKSDKTSQIPDRASKNDISNLLSQISKSVTDSDHQIEEAMHSVDKRSKPRALIEKKVQSKP